MSPERIVSLVNYDELIEASSESWMALLEAIDNSATAPEGTDDQVIRDMYAMLAANSADGAYATWLGNIYRPSTARHAQTYSTSPTPKCENRKAPGRRNRPGAFISLRRAIPARRLCVRELPPTADADRQS